MDGQGISWVTRLNERAVYRSLQSTPLSGAQKKQGIRKDQLILLGNEATQHINPLQKARLIHFYDKDSDRTFQFITNNEMYAASTIAEIYKKRWQIELFFKRIKQNFQVRYFLGVKNVMLSSFSSSVSETFSSNF